MLVEIFTPLALTIQSSLSRPMMLCTKGCSSRQKSFLRYLKLPSALHLLSPPYTSTCIRFLDECDVAQKKYAVQKMTAIFWLKKQTIVNMLTFIFYSVFLLENIGHDFGVFGILVFLLSLFLFLRALPARFALASKYSVSKFIESSTVHLICEKKTFNGIIPMSFITS